MTQHRLSLLSDRTQPLAAAAAFFAGIEPLLTALETCDRTDRQHKRQGRLAHGSSAPHLAPQLLFASQALTDGEVMGPASSPRCGCKPAYIDFRNRHTDIRVVYEVPWH